MNFATLDVLDKNLSIEYNRFIKANSELRFSFYKEELLLDPNYWDEYYDKLNQYEFE